MLDAVGLGLQGREERRQLGGGLPQPQLDVAELVAGPGELGRDRLQWRDGTLGARRQARGAVAVLRRKRAGCGRGSIGELREVAQSLALRTQLLLVLRLQAARV